MNVVQLSISGDDVALKNPEESTSSHSWSVTKSTSVNVTALKVDKTRNFAAIGGCAYFLPIPHFTRKTDFSFDVFALKPQERH